MKYYIDTEFIEGFHKPLFGNKRHFIDLISIGIVAEDGREFYAISKDFDLESAWNAYDQDPHHTRNYKAKKVYLLRDNVLKHLFNNKKFNYYENIDGFNGFKNLVNHFGKSNNQIAEEVFQFCTDDTLTIEKAKFYNVVKEGIEFYGYYSDYDWVLFCSLFGRMIDLPTGFPMYCRDLKQALDEKAKEMQLTLYAIQ